MGRASQPGVRRLVFPVQVDLHSVGLGHNNGVPRLGLDHNDDLRNLDMDLVVGLPLVGLDGFAGV